MLSRHSHQWMAQEERDQGASQVKSTLNRQQTLKATNISTIK